TLMNLFSVLIMAAFIFQAIRLFIPDSFSGSVGSELHLYLILGLFSVYSIKYLFFQFCGWVFQMQSLARHYLYQVFLIQKGIALVLVPATLVLAFGKEAMRTPLFWGAMTLVAILIINRYTRSWPAFAPLIRQHRFHFFAYL